MKKNCFLDISEENDVLMISMVGEIDHHSAARIRTEIDAKILKLRPQKTIIELSGIEFMDSSGLGLIMGRYMKMQAVGGALVLKNPNERIVKIFKLAGLEKIVGIEREKVVNETK